jgi:hypothetical protein
MRAPAATLAALLALAAAEAASRERAADAAPAGLRHEVAQLRLERELSTGKGFYLRLDAGRKRLALMLQGVTLDEYEASGFELGVPEVLFVDRRPRSGWDTEAISKGRLDPERQRDRIEVVAPPPAPSAAQPADGATPAPPPIPKSAEETVSVPSPYRIVFAEGVSVEVRSSGVGPPPLRSRLGARGRHARPRAAARHARRRGRGRALPLAAARRGADRRRPAAELKLERPAGGYGRSRRRRMANASAGLRTSSVSTSSWLRPAARSAGTKPSKRNACDR